MAPWAVLVPWLMWGMTALSLGGVGAEGPGLWRIAVGVGVVVGVAVGQWRGVGPWVATGAATGLTVGYLVGLRPSHDRPWSPDQQRLPRVERVGDTLTVTDLRAFRYRSPTDWDAAWTEHTWDLSQLEGMDFAVERFGESEAVAHTLVSFRFTDAMPLVVSWEIRKEVGETYGPVRGLFRQYELMVVLADERDAIELRAVHRGNPVYLHPMTAGPAEARLFLDSMLDHALRLETTPQYYNTVTASCTSVLAQHFEAVFAVPLDYRVYLPGYSDSLAFERGWIDTDVDFEATRAANEIGARARAAAGTDAFSDAIRRGRSDGSGGPTGP